MTRLQLLGRITGTTPLLRRLGMHADTRLDGRIPTP